MLSRDDPSYWLCRSDEAYFWACLTHPVNSCDCCCAEYLHWAVWERARRTRTHAGTDVTTGATSDGSIGRTCGAINGTVRSVGARSLATGALRGARCTCLLPSADLLGPVGCGSLPCHLEASKSLVATSFHRDRHHIRSPTPSTWLRTGRARTQLLAPMDSLSQRYALARKRRFSLQRRIQSTECRRAPRRRSFRLRTLAVYWVTPTRRASRNRCLS